MTRYEQETIINFNAEEETAIIYSADPVFIRKMGKYKDTEIIEETSVSKTWKVSKKWIKIYPSTPRKYTADQLEALRERAKRNFNRF